VAEDVQEFEKKVIEISSKRAQRQSQKSSGRLLKRDRDDEEDSDSEHGEGSDSEDDVKPEKRRVCFLVGGIWAYRVLIGFFL
jgi:hypothetical protein